MANRYWDGGASADPTNANNWSDTDGGATPASSVPGTGDVANFTANGDGNVCTATANWALGGLVILVGYTSKFDMVTFDLTMDDGADMTLDGAGEFDCGTGTYAITNGTLDYLDQGTWTRSSAAWVFDGTCNLIGKHNQELNIVTVNLGAVVTVPTASGNTIEIITTLTINGTISLETSQSIRPQGGCSVSIGASGEVTGAGTFIFKNVLNGKGLITNAGLISCSYVGFEARHAACVFAPGIVTAARTVISHHTDTASFAFSAGVYSFAELNLFNAAASDFTIDNTTNAPTSITAEDLVFDVDGLGDLIVDSTAVGTNWVITGDVIDQVTGGGGGGLTWTEGTGKITLSGTASQDIDFINEATEDLEIDKTTSGDVTLNNVDLELISSDMAGSLIVVTGDVTTATSAVISVDTDVTLDNNIFSMGVTSVWTIGGSFDCLDVTTFDDQSSSLVFTGTGDWLGANLTEFYDVTIDATAVITIPAGSGNALEIKNSFTLNGPLEVTSGKKINPQGACTMTIGAAGDVLGAGSFNFSNVLAGGGITSNAGDISCNSCTFTARHATAVLAPGTYSATATAIQHHADSASFAFSAGSYIFAQLILQNTNAADFTIDNTVNAPTSILVQGDLTFGTTSTGDLIIDDTAVGTNWSVQGDVIDSVTGGGGGSFTWTAGTGGLFFGQTANQDVDLIGATVPAITIAKGSGTVTFSSGFTAAAFLITGGGVDFNAQTVAFTGNFGMSAGTTFDGGATSLNGADITIGGTLTLDGQTLPATAGWALTLSADPGEAKNIMDVTVEQSDASGGFLVTAYNSTDGGSNTNWAFASEWSGPVNALFRRRRRKSHRGASSSRRQR